MSKRPLSFAISCYYKAKLMTRFADKLGEPISDQTYKVINPGIRSQAAKLVLRYRRMFGKAPSRLSVNDIELNNSHIKGLE